MKLHKIRKIRYQTLNLSQCLKVVLVLTLLTISCLLLTSCSSRVEPVVVPEVRIVYQAPEKIAVPEPPKFDTFDRNYPMNHPTNFKKFQRNTVFVVDYANQLKAIIKDYESQIDNINASNKK